MLFFSFYCAVVDLIYVTFRTRGTVVALAYSETWLPQQAAPLRTRHTARTEKRPPVSASHGVDSRGRVPASPRPSADPASLADTRGYRTCFPRPGPASSDSRAHRPPATAGPLGPAFVRPLVRCEVPRSLRRGRRGFCDRPWHQRLRVLLPPRAGFRPASRKPTAPGAATFCAERSGLRTRARNRPCCIVRKPHV